MERSRIDRNTEGRGGRRSGCESTASTASKLYKFVAWQIAVERVRPGRHDHGPGGAERDDHGKNEQRYRQRAASADASPWPQRTTRQIPRNAGLSLKWQCIDVVFHTEFHPCAAAAKCEGGERRPSVTRRSRMKSRDFRATARTGAAGWPRGKSASAARKGQNAVEAGERHSKF